MALSGTDGCFVCFGGNTFLIGKTEDGLFIFDSHVRCSRGYVSFTGKSTRIMFKHVEDVFLHMKSLAISMGFTRTVECELSGVLCAVKEFSIGEDCVEEREGTLKQGFSFSSQSDIDTSEEKVEKVNYSNTDCIMSNEFEAIQTDDIIIVGEEVKQQNFIPLSTEKKRNLCKNLKLPYCDLACEEKSSVKDMDKPINCKEIQQDGNCFFRAISFSVTNSENHHQHIREIVCQHLLNHETKFRPYMRSKESLRQYMISSRMVKDGAWATELEIFATSDLLKVDIFTFSNLRWLQFSLEGPEMLRQKEAIYLYHKQQNHYDVVLNVSEKRSDENTSDNLNKFCKTEYNLRKQNRLRMKTKRQNALKLSIDSIENRKSALRKKYNNNNDFRRRMLEQKKCMYLNVAFKSRTQMKSKNRYHENISYQSKQIKQGIQKYALDLEHRNKVLQRSKTKYFLDLKHREKKKKSLVRKYMFDDQHREHVKNMSKEKYRENIEYKESLKRRSIEKYKTDFEHRISLKRKIMKKYEEDETYRLKKKAANVRRYSANETFKARVQQRAAKRYQTSTEVQLKMKNCSKNSYQSSEVAKRKKKDKVGLNRKVKKLKLEEEEEVVRQFKERKTLIMSVLVARGFCLETKCKHVKNRCTGKMMHQRISLKSVYKISICTYVLKFVQKCVPNYHC